MRQTALEMVNDILSASESEVVTTIGETEESSQVLRILNRAINKLVNDLDWEHQHVITRLDTASGTTTTWSTLTYPDLPWVMGIPNNVESVYKVYYNQKIITYVKKDIFQYRFINLLGLGTDGDPKNYTIWDDKYLVFDKFDSDAESQLSASNSEILVIKWPGTDLDSDTDTSTLPNRFYSAVLNKALQYYYSQPGNKDDSLIGIYRTEYKDDKQQLISWATKNKAKESYNSNVDFSRKIPGTSYYQPEREITDLGPA